MWWDPFPVPYELRRPRSTFFSERVPRVEITCGQPSIPVIIVLDAITPALVLQDATTLVIALHTLTILEVDI
jgi:hypothetical protein